MAGVEAPCALIVMGVSGSGKSTVAELLGKGLGWVSQPLARDVSATWGEP